MLSARMVATAFDAYISACWRGDARRVDLASWLQTFWTPTPFRTDCLPSARSPHAAGGRGIDWYETTTHVIGMIPGLDGNYTIPVAAAMPSSLRGASSIEFTPVAAFRDALATMCTMSDCNCRA